MKIRELKRTAKASLKGNWGIAIGVFVIFAILNWIMSMPTGSIEIGATNNGNVSFVMDILSLVIMLFVGAPLQAGFNWFYLDMYDQKKLEVTSLFAGFKQYGKVVGVSFFTGLFTILWTLLLIVPGIIKGIGYSQAIFIIRENPDMGIFEAIKESSRMMKGYKWKYFLTMLSFIGWVILPIILFIGAGGLMLFGYIEFGDTIFGYADAASVGIGYFAVAVLLFIIALLYMLGISFYLTPYYQTTIGGFYRRLTTKEPIQEENITFSE